MDANLGSLVPRRESNWRMGFANMFNKENFGWWRTRRWWIQCLLWLTLMNVSLELNISGDFSPIDSFVNMLRMAGFGLGIAAISLAQDAILGERQSGTAAWVLSKPLRRPAYILAKLAAYALGLLVVGIVIPGVVAYTQLTLHGVSNLSMLDFAEAMGLVYLNTLFYLTLAFMLATLFDGRGPVLGIGIGLLIGIQIAILAIPAQVVKWLLEYLPVRLACDFLDAPLAGYLVVGEPLPTVTPVIATAVWCVLFIGVAIWRISREEF